MHYTYSYPPVVHKNGEKCIDEQVNKQALSILIEPYKESFDYIL